LATVLVITAIPVQAWVIAPNPAGEDNKYELYGPHIQGIIIKVYATTVAEWTDMQNHNLDIEDWALDPAWIATFGAVNGSWTEAYYGGEADYYVFDINNNATMAATDAGPFLPNPTSDFFLREALAYCINRSYIVSLDSTAIPIYTPVPAYMSGYINADIAPGQPGAQYTYGGFTGDYATANAILDAHFFPVDTGTHLRFWDYDHDGDTVKDAQDQPLNLIFYSRAGLRGDYGDHYNTVLNNVLNITTTYSSHVPRSTVTGPVFAQEDFNIYTGGWTGIGPDPDFLCDLYNGSNYYHPGSPNNYDGINYADLNTQLTAISLAPNITAGQAATLQAQYFFASHAAAGPLWSTSGIKAYANVPFATGAAGNWTHLVNQKGQGVNSWWSTLNMYQAGALYPNNYTYYGLSSTVTLQNEIYAQWYWDLDVLGRIYDGGAVRDPITLASWVPQLYRNWTAGTWTDPQTGETKISVTITLRPDVYWQDGQPLTSADVMYTLVECSRDLIDPARPGGALPPPWWYPTVQYMRSIEILDAYNIQVLLDVNSVWAVGWVIGSVVIPEHIWKSIIGQPNGSGGWTMAPSGATNAVQYTRPDPNIIGTGPFRWSSGTGDTIGSTVTLVANTPGSVVNGITGPGYYLYYPIYVDVNPDNGLIRVNISPTATSVLSNVTITTRNLWQGGNLTGSKYVFVNGALQGGFPVSKTLASIATWNVTYPYPADPAGAADVETLHLNFSQKSLNFVKVAFKVTGPATLPDGEPNPWIGTWVNVTLPLYVTQAMDIAGSTLYDDLGYGSYPTWLKKEVPTPDLKVDGRDIAVVQKTFGTYAGSTGWNSIADVNRDYKIDGKDIVLINRQFGWGFVW